ncbi:MAG TPA: hypothetical protein VF201_05650 [Nitrolancea sp.]
MVRVDYLWLRDLLMLYLRLYGPTTHSNSPLLDTATLWWNAPETLPSADTAIELSPAIDQLPPADTAID